MAANGFPDRGTGRGYSKRAIGAIPEPLGDVFFFDTKQGNKNETVV
jgi:hypothetical protein